MMGTYIGNCLEKWLIDEELCGIVRKMMTHLEYTEETIDVETIKRVGIGGNFLMDPTTFKHCRTAFYNVDLYNKQDQAGWKRDGAKRIDEVSADRLVKRLASYEKPSIDPDVEIALSEFIARRKTRTL